jgi:CheY-like chemotaxis protein
MASLRKRCSTAFKVKVALEAIQWPRAVPDIFGELGPQPNLILLDLNMPRTDGHTALVEIKSEPAFVVPRSIFAHVTYRDRLGI